MRELNGLGYKTTQSNEIVKPLITTTNHLTGRDVQHKMVGKAVDLNIISANTFRTTSSKNLLPQLATLNKPINPSRPPILTKYKLSLLEMNQSDDFKNIGPKVYQKITEQDGKVRYLQLSSTPHSRLSEANKNSASSTLVYKDGDTFHEIFEDPEEGRTFAQSFMEKYIAYRIQYDAVKPDKENDTDNIQFNIGASSLAPPLHSETPVRKYILTPIVLEVINNVSHSMADARHERAEEAEKEKMDKKVEEFIENVRLVTKMNVAKKALENEALEESAEKSSMVKSQTVVDAPPPTLS